jgi:hypothetical protein
VSSLFSFEFVREALHLYVLETLSSPLSLSGSIETADEIETPLESAPRPDYGENKKHLRFSTLKDVPSMNLSKDLIKATKGKFFSIVYTRKDGQTNKYVCRTGVHKYLTGGQNYAPANSVTVYAPPSFNGQRAGYKTFLLENIKEIRIGNITYSR